MLTPKSRNLLPTLSGTTARIGGKFFEDGFKKFSARICDDTPAGFPITVFYAFKQAENDDDGRHASTGWETLLEGMIRAGWAVTGTWPMRTE